MSITRSNKKLLAYSLLSSAFLTVTSEVDAQAIFYTDHVPNLSINGRLPLGFDEEFLDVNTDGVFDFRIWASDEISGGSSAGGREINIEALNANQFAVELDSNTCYSTWTAYRDVVQPITTGENVAPTLNWAGGSGTVSSNTWFSGYGYCFPVWGNFSTSSVAHIGIRLKDGSDWHYGWIRVKRNLLAFIEIYDHALNAIPNQPLPIDGAALTNCEPPTGLGVSFISPSIGELSWTAVTDAEKYLVTGTLVGSTANYSKTTLNNLLTAPGLSAGATYEWKVRAQCDGGTVSPESISDTFTPPIPFESGTESAAAVDDASMRVSTVDRQLTISVQSMQAGKIEMTLTNTTGAILDQWTENVEAGFSMIQLDCSDVPAGLYIVSVRKNGLVESAKVFVD